MTGGNMLLSRLPDKTAERREDDVRNAYGVNRALREPPADGEVLRCANGTFVGRRRGDVAVWRGVPYAQPPTGPRRWKAPEPAEDGGGVYEAYFNGKSPIQTAWETELASFYPQGEDCLYLNVWKNTAVKTEKKPVMVFFHGGSYGWGGTADPLYDGHHFVRAHGEVILVTVGYRTGLMGFVDFSAVPGGEDYPDAPNLGILDQLEALRWVRKNAAALGADADNVTIFGESAGGGSVSLLPLIPAARGLFRRVIAQSGSVALTFSKAECQSFTRRLMRQSGAKSMDDLLALDEDALKALNEPLNAYNNFPQRDGVLIPVDPYEPYEKGQTAGVDLLIGTNANELNYWVGEIGGLIPFRFGVPVKFENDLRRLTKDDRRRVERFMQRLRDMQHAHSIWRMAEFYNEVMFRLPAVRQAQAHAQNGGRAYMYYWTKSSAIPFRGACHAVELAYVFGNLDQTIYTGGDVDETLANAIQAMWASFAVSGDPGTAELPWPPYSAEDRATMVLSESPFVQRDVLDEQRRLLEPLTRYMLNASYAELDYNVPFVRRAVGLTAAAALGGALLFRAVKKSRKNREG